ncbi:MAG TPA: hypothetical protein VF331_10040 [Polyangiales bacterium]
MPADLRALLKSLGAKAQGEGPRSERVLERLLDLERCVALGDVLDQPLRSQALEPGLRRALEEAQLARLRLVEAKLLASLRDLRAQIDRRFEHAFSGGRSAPDAAALHALLSEGGGLQVGGDARRRAVAAQATARYVAVVNGAVEVVLKELGWRQKDVQQALQQGSAETLRLAALDRVLDEIFRTELSLSRLQLEASLGQALQMQLRTACATLAVDASAASADALQPWFGPRGCIGHFLRDARRACHALLDLEWSALMGLLQAALQATGASAQSAEAGAASSPERDEP